MRYRAPKVWSSDINKAGEVNPFFADKAGRKSNTPLKLGLISLKIWENLRAELVQYIRTNEQGQTCFPISSYFLRTRPDIAGAVRHFGGFVAVFKRLQKEGILPLTFQPVTDGTAKVKSERSLTMSLSDWENMCAVMTEICHQLGRFPSTTTELVDMGYKKEVGQMKTYYGTLAFIEIQMREEGRLAFLDKNKEIH